MAEFKGRGFRMHFVEQGAGPAVVFVHGFGMDHTMFAPQFEDLPDHYRCVALDLRGHGDSETPPGPWSLQDLVVDVIRFIDGANAAPCHLVGMSLGGMIALRIALQREDLVRSLVLIDTSADAEGPERMELYRGYQQSVSEQGVTPELVDATLPLFYGQRYLETQPEGIEAHRERARRISREAVFEGVRAMINRPSVAERLGEVHVPTLVIHGEEDATFPIVQAERLAGGIEGAELLRIPECGHTSPLEAADAVNEALAAFLEKVP